MYSISKKLFFIIIFAIFSFSLFSTEISSVTNAEISSSQSGGQNQNLIKITIAGDLMAHYSQIRYAKTKYWYDFSPQFSQIKKILKDSSLVIANLETTISTARRGYNGYPLFKTPSSYIAALKEAGFDILTFSNNHMLDSKSFGIDYTLKTLASYHIATTGAYKNKESAHTPLIFEHKGIKFAFVAVCHSLNGNEGFLSEYEQSWRYTKIQDKENLEKLFLKAKEANPDFIIAFPHWGDEYIRSSNESQKKWAKTLANLGADFIIGSHPHVVQEAQLISVDFDSEKKVPVIYSLGNVVANMAHSVAPYSDSGMMVNLYFDFDEKGKPLFAKIDYQPIWIHIFKTQNEFDKECRLGYQVLPLFDDLSKVEEDENLIKLNDYSKKRYSEAYKEVTEIVSCDFLQVAN